MRRQFEFALKIMFALAIAVAYLSFAGGIIGLLPAKDVAAVSFIGSIVAGASAIGYLVAATTRIRRAQQ